MALPANLFAVLVCHVILRAEAKFFIEYKTEPNPWIRNDRPTMKMFSCATEESSDDPYSAFCFYRSVIHCTEVNSGWEHDQIYQIANFYLLHQPNMAGIRIILHISQERTVPLPPQWALGFLHHQLDHPNFRDGTYHDLAYHQRLIVEMLGIGNRNTDIVPHHQDTMNYLAKFLGILKVRDLLEESSPAPLWFSAFATILNRITTIYNRDVAQARNPRSAETIKRQLKKAMQTVLQKMIDPCTFLNPNISTSLCLTYCKFLSVVALAHSTVSCTCNSLSSGRCVTNTCQCSRNFFAISVVRNDVDMRFCNNFLRKQVNLLIKSTNPQ